MHLWHVHARQLAQPDQSPLPLRATQVQEGAIKGSIRWIVAGMSAAAHILCTQVLQCARNLHHQPHDQDLAPASRTSI